VHALKLAERLCKMKVDVTLYSLARSDDPKGVDGYFRQVIAPFQIFKYEWSSDLVTRLDRMIDAYAEGLPKNADIYHAQDCVGGTALARLKSKGSIKAPIFRTIHHVDDFAEPRLIEFEKKAVAHADHRFVVSKYWQKALKEDYGYDSVVTYNGLDIDDFIHLQEKTGTDPTILFVGGLEPRKGLEYLLHAMEYILDELPSTKLIAIGKTGFRGTDEWSWFSSLADRLGITGHVEFHESVSQENLLRFYSECDVLVLPSKTEGWGLSLMEAMACGKPVVASGVGGIPELVRDGTDGILVRPGDVRGLAEAVTMLLKNPTLRKEMGQSGKARVGEFSWDETAKVALREYEKALQSR